jgi:hypothetical protein
MNVNIDLTFIIFIITPLLCSGRDLKRVGRLVFLTLGLGMGVRGAPDKMSGECSWLSSGLANLRPCGTVLHSQNTINCSFAVSGGGKGTQKVFQKCLANEKPEIQWEVGFLVTNSQNALEKFDFGSFRNGFGWCVVKKIGSLVFRGAPGRPEPTSRSAIYMVENGCPPREVLGHLFSNLNLISIFFLMHSREQK